MFVNRLPAILAGALLSGCASSALAADSARRPAPISLDTLKSATQTMSTDAFEGRAPTTAGEEKAVAFIADQFRKAGLKPGNKGSWYQNVPLVENTASPSQMTIGGGRTPLVFDYRKDFVANTYQVQPRTELAASELVFVGYGINAPERGWNDYAGLDVRGKTVVILVNDPDWQASDLNGRFGGKAMTYYGRWTYKYEEAARQGAAGALIVHQTEPAAYGWNVVQSSWTGAQYNMDDPDNHMDQSKMVGWLTQDAAQRLFAASGKDLGALVEAAKQPGFKAVPLGTNVSIRLDNQIKRQASRNVIGVLPGARRPDEYVIYTAHWDHLGRCDADPSGDDICNGAVDNASGTAGLIALAEAHAKTGAADRSIVFVAVTGEESGLLGSQYYAENPVYPLASTVGGVNMDSLSLAGDARDFVAVGGGKSELDTYLGRALGGLTVKPEPSPQAGYYYRSDHFSLAKKGVPMLYAKLGNDLVKGGTAAGEAWQTRYRAERYHGPNDEYDPTWDWSGALHELQIYWQIGRDLATGSAWPNWNQGDEFRAIRDRSRSGAAGQ
ncbi:M28 family metallopeptidase [Allosphingosinicella deserti]|uniref:Peptidase M28 n=1 Tax=Allosphingosinicella deserti TaxID=2116704 RepID=A0A2P7QJ78_9SPHN|nr:M28 family metallopeptidase [Sphingomonas deserti]PSJ38027.1 peptidase M28 [Sphingomonas deserti]